MTTYLAVFLLLIAADILILNNHALKARRGFFVLFATCLLTLLSGLRHESIGGRDVYISYKGNFYHSLETPWSEVLKNLISTEVLIGDVTEPGYSLFVKLVSSFTSNYQVFLFVMALVFMIPFGWFIYRYSADPFISFIVYYVVFFSFFSLTGFRQTIATSIAVLLSYPSLTRRQPFKFATFIALAFFFHRSALIYALIYPVSAVFATRGRSRGAWLAATVLGVVTVVISQIGGLADAFGYTYGLESNIGGTGTFVALVLVVLAAILLRRKRILESSKFAFINVTGVALGGFFALQTFWSQTFMRVQQYFSLLLVLAIPEFILSFAERDRIVVRIAVTGTLFLLMVRADSPYLFFWQG